MPTFFCSSNIPINLINRESTAGSAGAGATGAGATGAGATGAGGILISEVI